VSTFPCLPFLGAIGGFLSSGIIVLFLGAVVLALGYKLFLNRLKQEDPSATMTGHSRFRS
jgi:hypothetical protein